MEYAVRAVQKGSLITMIDGGALLGTVHFEHVPDEDQFHRLAVRDGFLSRVSTLLGEIPLPLVYVHVLHISPRWRGKKLGLTLLSYCRDYITEQWDGVPAVGVCKDSLVPHWKKMGAEFTGASVPWGGDNHHLFYLGKPS